MVTKIRVLSVLSAAVLFLGFSAVPAEAARTVEDIRSEQAALAQKQEELKTKLSELESEAETSAEYQRMLDEEITVVEQQITTSSKDIETLDESILELEKKVKESEAQYQDVMDKLKIRIKAIYESGSVGTLEILMNAKSLTDYSMKAELMKNMTRYDKELMETISGRLKETQDERAQLKEQKETVADLKKNLEQKNEELVLLEKKNRRTLESLRDHQVLTEQTLEESYAFGDDLANEMAAIIAARPKKGAGEKDEVHFKWPCPDYAYISDHFGGDRGHKGLDIAANYGVPILAAESGTVVLANDSDEWGYSWGYYVSVYHNETYSTLYAHCSSLAVTEGQEVKQGQVIAYVGSTGNSNGNHLHFEVYQGGTRVDPEPFLG